jgi:DNA-binding transcriptional MocR family regulator
MLLTPIFHLFSPYKAWGGPYFGEGPYFRAFTVFQFQAGNREAREALVAKFSTPDAPFTADDVFLGSGCSHALELAIVAIAGAGDNILVPAPGYPVCASWNVIIS